MAKLSEMVLVALGLADLGTEMPIPGERRREYRRPVKLAGVCETMDPFFRLDCTVVDITNSGAQLVFENINVVPDRFRLYLLQQNIILDCKVAWRRENNLGVSFTPVWNDFDGTNAG